MTEEPKRVRTGAYCGFRCPADLKNQLETAAKANGRSLSTEIQFRLEVTFVRAPVGGGPRRTPEEAERVPLGLRVTPETKLRLELLADLYGRSQSQEAERLIQLALDLDEIAKRIIELQSGKRTAFL